MKLENLKNLDLTEYYGVWFKNKSDMVRGCKMEHLRKDLNKTFNSIIAKKYAFQIDGRKVCLIGEHPDFIPTTNPQKMALAIVKKHQEETGDERPQSKYMTRAQLGLEMGLMTTPVQHLYERRYRGNLPVEEDELLSIILGKVNYQFRTVGGRLYEKGYLSAIKERWFGCFRNALNLKDFRKLTEGEFDKLRKFEMKQLKYYKCVSEQEIIAKKHAHEYYDNKREFVQQELGAEFIYKKVKFELNVRGELAAEKYIGSADELKEQISRWMEKQVRKSILKLVASDNKTHLSIAQSTQVKIMYDTTTGEPTEEQMAKFNNFLDSLGS
jgi:hypothetical protein